MTDRGVTIEDLDEIDGVISTPLYEKPEPSKQKTRPTALSKRLAKLIRLIGNVVEPLDKFDGQVFKDNANDIADALADLAQESPRVRAILEGSLEGGAWTAVGLVVGGKLVLPMAVHHRWLPEPLNTNLAETMEIPVRKKKVRRSENDEPETGEWQDRDPDEVPRHYGTVRDPDTGEMVTVPLDPATLRPKVDGDGRPIIDDSE